MKLILISSLAFIVAYLIIYINRYGVPVTFSHTYKIIKQKWAFTVVLTIFGVSLALNADTTMFFFCGALLCLVGVSRHYWEPGEKTLHFIGAIGSVLLGMASLIIDFQNYWALPAFLVFYLLFEDIFSSGPIIKIKNHTFYTEIVGFLLLAISLLII